jgi:hypothetical protein
MAIYCHHYNGQGSYMLASPLLWRLELGAQKAPIKRRPANRSKIGEKGRKVPYFDGFVILKYDELVHGRGIKHVVS